jgi:high-affinity Fe2+/Pb2+ permease
MAFTIFPWMLSVVNGGFNYGLWTFEDNEFVNDVQGGTNGIYLQSISGAQGEVIHTILIQNNVFKTLD